MFGQHPHFGCSLYVWMPPVCLESPYMFGCPPPCLNTPICLDGPIFLDVSTVCLDAPICLDAHLYVWIPPYVRMSPSMFVDPICMDAPICLDNPLYVWMPLIPLDTPICLDAYIQTHRGKPNIWRTSKHTRGVQTCGDVQPYRGVSKDKGHPNIWGVQTYGVCPNIQVGIQTYEGVQTYGDIQT